jgi:hypothetical protein
MGGAIKCLKMIRISEQKQHFVNAGYLRGFGFSDEKSKEGQFIYEYNKNSNTAPLEPKSVKEVCKIRGHNSDQVELMLQKIEDKAVRIIRKLEPIHGKLINIKNEDIEILLSYMVLMFLRNPSYRDGVEAFYRELKPTSEVGHMDSLVVFEIEDLIKKAILESKYPFFCLTSEAVKFITSDNPVLFDFPFKKELVGLAPPIVYKNVDILFPLRRDVLLLFKHFKYSDKEIVKNLAGRCEFLKTQDVKGINCMIAAAALENVYTDVSNNKIASMVYKRRQSSQKLKIN